MHARSWLPLTILLLAGPLPAAVRAAEIPLAIVGADTLTTSDLELELSIMRQRSPEGAAIALPPAGDVLRRLIENLLVVQEGYRMNLQEEFTVKNQVTEAVRTQCAKSLLDSVAAAVPAATADLVEARRQAVKDYVDGLKKRYVTALDQELLQSLDYASADPQVQQQLKDSEAVLAVVPPGPLTVKGLSRQIRFTEFHGLTGRADAAERRDKIFDEWLIEVLLRHEARVQGLPQRPDLLRYARRLERQLMQEESLKVLVDLPFEPTPAQVEAYYAKHLADVTPDPRIKLESLKFESEEAAKAARQRLQQGAKVSWVRKNTPGVVEGPAPIPETLIDPGLLGLAAADLKVGGVPEPFKVPNGWVVAVVTEIERPAPAPLATCRDQIVKMMRGENTRTQMTAMLARLEAATAVTILPGAEAEVARRLETVKGDADVTPNK